MGDILVVDDEPKLGKIVAEMLELDGHHVQRVGGGKQALTAMDNFAMDVVVTDLRMPDVDGLAVLAAAVQAGGLAGRDLDDRAREHRERCGGDEARGGRLPDQALLDGGAPGPGEAAVRAAGDAPEVVGPRRAAHAPPGRREPGDARDPRRGDAGGAHAHHGAADGRERHREESDRAAHPLRERGLHRPPGGGALRRAPRGTARDPSSSATRRGRSPARSSAAWATSPPPREAPCSSTRSGRSPRPRR